MVDPVAQSDYPEVMATVETSTLKPASQIVDVAPEHPPPEVEAVAPAPPARRRRRKATQPAPEPELAPEEPLSHAELALIGSLTVRARANGLDLEGYVEELRAELRAFAKLEASDG